MWVGWLHTGTGWVEVAHGHTLSACADRLHAEAQRRGIRANLCRGLTTGAPPRWTARGNTPASPLPAPQSHAGQQDDNRTALDQRNAANAALRNP